METCEFEVVLRPDAMKTNPRVRPRRVSVCFVVRYLPGADEKALCFAERVRVALRAKCSCSIDHIMDQVVVTNCRAKGVTTLALLNTAMVHIEFDAVSKVYMDIQHFYPPYRSVGLTTSHIITCLLDTLPFTIEVTGI